jgi:transposase, IS5 family
MGEDLLNALVQESLAVAVKTKALRIADLAHVIVDTTVQEKAAMFQTDARLLDRARVRFVQLAKTIGVVLRQSYVRVGKLALMKHQRYAHAKHFKRAKAKLHSLRTYLGRTMRDIERSRKARPDLNALFRRELFNAARVLEHKRGRRQPLHAPEVEYIAKGKRTNPTTSASKSPSRRRCIARPG